jgi:hypothetical protein
MSTEETHPGDLLQRAAMGDEQAVNALFTLHRGRRRAMVRFLRWMSE